MVRYLERHRRSNIRSDIGDDIRNGIGITIRNNTRTSPTPRFAGADNEIMTKKEK
ncbi:hypothetical protein HM1_1038 [Heliomicrobium modesticaldum Ice1]|uniref:Uncharacterized protein n=1 Tax=Heliobacterium modesticaldum (strain ATCC 51547 / Ice1) TaxID=498761 RepID=B0TIB6_HELMI|nr:hypothetical protein [Heliomicrobium modesticaldum]ABZ83536.1 hypothetical protein HM1_1038 [Heliomicrobium modesticaldum Ice1]